MKPDEILEAIDFLATNRTPDYPITVQVEIDGAVIKIQVDCDDLIKWMDREHQRRAKERNRDLVQLVDYCAVG